MLAHLYAAGKFFNLRDPVWPDMEMMLERQGKTRLFVGDLPASFEDAQKKLLLASGASASNFVRSRRNNNMSVNRYNAQHFENRSMIAGIYQERMYKEPDTKEATELTRKLIQTIKSSRKSLKTPTRVKSTRFPTQARDWKPLEILEELRDWLVEDAVDLYFDWYGMDKICADIWTNIKTVFSQKPNNRVNIHANVLSVAGDILSAAAEKEIFMRERKAFREYIQEQQIGIAPELTVVWKIIQDTIRTPTSLPGRPSGWMGDRCIRRLLYVNPEAVLSEGEVERNHVLSELSRVRSIYPRPSQGTS
jgi:hypothetical protein